MENQKFKHKKLSEFYNYAMRQDISILLIRQHAYSLLIDGMDDDGECQLSDSLLDKLITFLRTDETQYGGKDTTGLYAFQKHLSEIRKALRQSGNVQHAGVMTPSEPSTPSERSPV